MPQHAVPLALLFFNVGVELGQLLFIAAVFGFAWLVRLSAVRIPAIWPRAVAYGVGSVAAFWVVERTIAVFWPRASARASVATWARAIAAVTRSS